MFIPNHSHILTLFVAYNNPNMDIHHIYTDFLTYMCRYADIFLLIIYSFTTTPTSFVETLLCWLTQNTSPLICVFKCFNNLFLFIFRRLLYTLFFWGEYYETHFWIFLFAGKKRLFKGSASLYLQSSCSSFIGLLWLCILLPHSLPTIQLFKLVLFRVGLGQRLD